MEEKTINKLTREERETIISISDDQTDWNAYTNIPKDARKFEKQGWVKTDEKLYSDGTLLSASFTAPRKAIGIAKANKVKRIISEEQREILSERMKKVAQNKKLEKEKG